MKKETEFEKFDSVMEKLLAVPYAELQEKLKEEKKEKLKRKKERAKISSPAPRVCNEAKPEN